MTTPKKSRPYWTTEEAQQWLPEILRLAETQGPQGIQTDRAIIRLTAELLPENAANRLPFGQWLVQNMPRGTNLEIPRESRRCDCEKRFLDAEADVK